MTLNTTGNKGKTHTELEGGKGREIYFRPERYDENSLGNINKEVVFLDSELNEIHGKIVNISQNGLAFALDQRSYYKSGDVIPNMKILLNNDIVYKGSICITNSRFNSDGTVVYGARLLDSMLNVKTIIRLKDLKEYYETFRDEFTSIMELINSVKFDEYKALLNDFRLFLLKIRERLIKIQNDFDIDPHNFSMENHIHRGVVRIMDELLEEPTHKYFEKFNELTEGLDETTAENLKIITRACIHDLTLEGAICRRSFEKPLGYAGDFEIMNYLYGDHLLGNNLFAKFMHRVICRIPISRAVVSRKNFLKQKIKEKIETFENRQTKTVKILSIACGPAVEVFEYLLENNPSIGVEFILFDQDKEALSHCFSKFSDLMLSRTDGQVKIRYFHDSIKRLIFEKEVFKDYRPFDLIYTAGLFDYLPKKVAVMLTNKLFANLTAGGTLYIGNMNKTCTSKWVLEHIGDWNLIYRTEAELLDLACEIPDYGSRRITAEPLGINLFLLLENTHNGDTCR